MSFGVPYKGSKNLIAKQIISLLPSSSTLYDVFSGGCAITHCALCSNKFQRVVAIDDNDISVLFVRAWNGEQFPPRWVTRDEYFATFRTDPFVRSLWSFGNKPSSYIYGLDLEPLKHAMYDAVFGDFTRLRDMFPDRWEEAFEALAHIPLANIYDRRIALGTIVGRNFLGQTRTIAVENLARLNRLNSIAPTRDGVTAKLEFVRTDYRLMSFDDPNGIIYCDPPYRDTEGYGNRRRATQFNSDMFYSWCEKQKLPVYISEYYMPDDRFKCIAAFDKNATICSSKVTAVVEKIWRPRCQLQE